MNSRQRSLFAATTLVFVGCASSCAPRYSYDQRISALTRDYVAGRISLRRFVQLREMVEAERSLAQSAPSTSSDSGSGSMSCDTSNRAEEALQEKQREEQEKKDMAKRQAIGQALEKIYPSQPVPRR